MKDESQQQVPPDCTECGGEGFISYNSGKHETCPACKGTGSFEVYSREDCVFRYCDSANEECRKADHCHHNPPPSQQGRSGSQLGKEDTPEELAEKFIEHTDITDRKECWLAGYHFAQESQPSQLGEGKETQIKKLLPVYGVTAEDLDDAYIDIDSIYNAQPALPEQGKEEAFGGKEVTILDLVEEKRKLQWKIVDLKDQLAALRAESQAKDTRIRELWTDEQVYAFGGRIYNALAGDYTKEEWSGLDAHFKDFKKNHNK